MSGYFDLTNTGNRPVRLERIYTERLIPGATPSFAIVRARIQTEPVNSGFSPRYSKPFRPLTIQPDESVFLVLDYRTACSSTTPVGGSAAGSWVDIRYSYLHVFHRTRTIDMPMAVAVQCRGKLPASTPVPESAATLRVDLYGGPEPNDLHQVAQIVLVSVETAVRDRMPPGCRW